jgi:predicted Zn-dependent peptidase
MKTPDFWLGRLTALDYRGLSLDDLLDAPSQYQQFTTAQVQEAFARYHRADASLRFVVTPR